IEVDGIPAIVDFGGWLDGVSFHAVDPAKHFNSGTGFWRELGRTYALGRNVGEHAEALFRDELATSPDTIGSAKRKPRKGPPPLPETVYRLPASWQEIAPGTRECAPIEIETPPVGTAAPPAEAPPTVRKKRGHKTVQADIDDFTASADRDGARLDDLARDHAETVERLCDLAPSEGEALHDRAVAAGHTIRMTRANLTNEHVASCACGEFDFRIAGGPDPDGSRHAVMDAAIVDHWRAVLGEAAPETPAAPSPGDDFPDMPEGLRRHRDPPPAVNDDATNDAGEGRHDDAA
ncbi:hypothetical protein RA307_31775, partial [Xanthobacteraceae bacterium Astr-EGSB]|uniref:hypothetical protein n=1 Tax=Astrobacterium formosum TaxID=3069710 RepID=UPI0027B55EAA|nr:hypothetical protein [Xanthobacteraceae bacterium Astr-EGSB]